MPSIRALRRMHAGGLLLANESEDARRSVRYSLSAAGRRVYAAWLKDIERASGSGLDPFRCRADYWCLLPAVERKALLRALMRKLAQRIEMLSKLFGRADTPEQRALWLEVELCNTRLKWLRLELAER